MKLTGIATMVALAFALPIAACETEPQDQRTEPIQPAAPAQEVQPGMEQPGGFGTQPGTSQETQPMMEGDTVTTPGM